MSVEAFLEGEYAVLLSHPAVRSVEFGPLLGLTDWMAICAPVVR